MDAPKKISTKIWRPILEKLDQKLDAACLRRDAYLNRVLEVELDFLDKEVSIPNSLEAFSFVSERVDQLDRKLVSLALRPDLIDRLNEICQRKRIVRDAFFNRLFLLLAGSPKTIDHLLFRGADWRTEVWSECKNDGPAFHNTFYPLEQDIDPFWAIRAGLELFSEDTELHDYTVPGSGDLVKVQRDLGGEVYPTNSIYTILFTNTQVKAMDLYGLNCYVPDWQIPNHPAELEYRKRLDDLFAEL